MLKVFSPILLTTAFLCSQSVSAAPNIRQFLAQPIGQATFRCAFQGKAASRPCTVKLTQEQVTNPTVVAFHGAGQLSKVFSVYWPDGDVSRYVEIDSLELVNLTERNGTGYNIRTREWPEVDWSRGYVIEKNGREWLRLW